MGSRLFFLCSLLQPPFVFCPPLLWHPGEADLGTWGPWGPSSHVSLLDCSRVAVRSLLGSLLTTHQDREAETTQGFSVLEIRDPGVKRVGFCSASPVDLWVRPPSPCVVIWPRPRPLPCTWVQISSYKLSSPGVLGPTLMTTFTLMTSFGPVSRYRHILRYWGLRLEHTNLAGVGA